MHTICMARDTPVSIAMESEKTETTTVGDEVEETFETTSDTIGPLQTKITNQNRAPRKTRGNLFMTDVVTNEPE